MLQGRSIMTYVPLPGDGRPHVVTLIPGDGIGPEVTDVVTKVVDVLGAPLVWERCVHNVLNPVSMRIIAPLYTARSL
jgi:hypothetical protein